MKNKIIAIFFHGAIIIKYFLFVFQTVWALHSALHLPKTKEKGDNFGRRGGCVVYDFCEFCDKELKNKVSRLSTRRRPTMLQENAAELQILPSNIDKYGKYTLQTNRWYLCRNHIPIILLSFWTQIFNFLFRHFKNEFWLFII